jgi:hypothetical protein
VEIKAGAYGTYLSKNFSPRLRPYLKHTFALSLNAEIGSVSVYGGQILGLTFFDG